MASRNLLVKILGDDRDLQRAFASSSRGATQFGTSVERSGKKADTALRNVRALALGTGAAFAGGIVAGEAIRQVGDAISVASNLNEQIARSRVVFEGSASAVEAWSETTAASIGIAQDEALAAAGTFGAMFSQAGQASADAARLSESVVALASDLASFNNASIDDTLTALRSGLSGEIEPLRKFQVFLTEAAVSQRALIDTGKQHVEQLTQGEKIMARWALILEQTGKQQGDYARTSDSLANQQRRLSAEIRDLQAAAGAGLLPVMTNLTNFAGDATVAIQELGDALDWLGRQKITPLQIPINFTIVDDQGGGGLKAGDLLKFNIVEVVQLGIDAAMGTGPFGQGERKVPPQEITRGAKAFEDAFTPFTDATIKGGKDAAAKSRAKITAALITAAFGDPGFKIVPNDLAARLQRQFDEAMDALSLSFDQARVTPGAADELRVLDEQEAAVRKRIESGHRTTALERELFRIQQDRAQVLEGLADQRRQAREDAADRARNAAEAQRRAREQAAAERQEDQFRALGLTAQGGQIVPGVANLRRQLAQLTTRLVDEGEMTPKIRAQLNRIRDVLAGEAGRVTEDSRETIRDMFQDIRGAFDEESDSGFMTRTTSLSKEKILAGLGLDRDTERILRARLSGFNSAGRRIAGTPGATGAYGMAFGAGGQPIEITVISQLDGEKVGRSVTKHQGKSRRSNPRQKRGPMSGI